VQAVIKRFPDVLLQWEDFASVDAERLLHRYRDRLCTFNDDIQGTAAVTTGTILSAVAATGGELPEQRFVMLGAGSAGIGITQQLIQTMVSEGVDESEARKRFYLIDRHGLLHEGRSNMSDVRRPFAQPDGNLGNWDCDLSSLISLEDVVRNAQPTVLIGATGQSGAFTEEIIREMARHTSQPIVFPLSNPTSRAEATPEDLIRWTDGKAIIATGSPFDPVVHNGATHQIAQCNNSYIFPAMGLAVLASGTQRVTDGMFMAAAMALKDLSPALASTTASLLPPLSEIRTVTRHIAKAVAQAAQTEGVAEKTSDEELEKRLEETVWEPRY
ncbi:MAG: oxaloacetate-decarboxylating malate dehydrogenase, partial [Rubripirellula sp.]